MSTFAIEFGKLSAGLRSRKEAGKLRGIQLCHVKSSEKILLFLLSESKPYNRWPLSSF